MVIVGSPANTGSCHAGCAFRPIKWNICALSKLQIGNHFRHFSACILPLSHNGAKSTTNDVLVTRLNVYCSSSLTSISTCISRICPTKCEIKLLTPKLQRWCLWIREWIRNFIPHFMMDSLWLNFKKSMLIKGPQRSLKAEPRTGAVVRFKPGNNSTQWKSSYHPQA